jgi:hypothetical protein
MPSMEKSPPSSISLFIGPPHEKFDPLRSFYAYDIPFNNRGTTYDFCLPEFIVDSELARWV